MEITLEAIISLIGIVVGGGSIGGFLFWKQTKKRAIAEAKLAEAEAKIKEAEARKAEIEAAEEKQEYYQRIIDDVIKDRDYYKQARDELREQIDKIMRSVVEWKETSENERNDMKRDVMRLGRKVDAMAPFMCGDLTCKLRQRVTISDDGVVSKATSKKQKPREQKDIEPIDNQDL